MTKLCVKELCVTMLCVTKLCVCVPILCVKELCVRELGVRQLCMRELRENARRRRRRRRSGRECTTEKQGNHIPKKLLVSHPHFATYPIFRRSSSERSRVKKHMRCGGRQFSGSRATANLGFRRRTQSTAPAQRGPGHCGSNGQAPPFTSMCKYKFYK